MPTTVYGPTFAGIDLICDSKVTQLERAEIGDWLIFQNMGAYSYTGSFLFNGFTHIPKKTHCISTAEFNQNSTFSEAEAKFKANS